MKITKINIKMLVQNISEHADIFAKRVENYCENLQITYNSKLINTLDLHFNCANDGRLTCAIIFLTNENENKITINEDSIKDNIIELNKLQNDTDPYLIEYQLIKHKKFNYKYDQNKTCECEHAYYRHFDSYEDYDAVGCK